MCPGDSSFSSFHAFLAHDRTQTLEKTSQGRPQRAQERRATQLSPKTLPSPPRIAQGHPRATQLRPKIPPRVALGPLRSQQEAPRPFKRPKRLQEAPRGAQEDPRGTQEGAQGIKKEPKSTQKAPQRHPRAPKSFNEDDDDDYMLMHISK